MGDGGSSPLKAVGSEFPGPGRCRPKNSARNAITTRCFDIACSFTCPHPDLFLPHRAQGEKMEGCFSHFMYVDSKEQEVSRQSSDTSNHPVTCLPASTPVPLQSVLHPVARIFLLTTSCHPPAFNPSNGSHVIQDKMQGIITASRALHGPVLPSPLPSLAGTFPPDALDSLLLLQQDQLVFTHGPSHMSFPLPGSFFHSM